MSSTIATVLLCVAMQPNLTVAKGQPRHFGDCEIKRVIHVEGEGEYDLEWQTRILRGIVESDQTRVAAPEDLEVELKLPTVRARINLIQEIQLKHDQEVLVATSVVSALFPNDILSQFAATQSTLPEVGLCDPAGVIAPLFEAAGLKFKLLQRNFQIANLDSKLVIVAPEQSLHMTEPTEGLQGLLQNGGTVILLKRSELPEWFFSADDSTPVSSGACAGAELVVDGSHPIARDILPGDLHNWAGTGRVASNALTPCDWAHYRPILVSSGKADRMPLLAEYWDGNGRGIICQLDIAARLQDEPIAQVLLRNLISYARETPLPSLPHVLRLGIPEDALVDGKFMTNRFIQDPSDEQINTLAALLLLVTPKGHQAPAAGFDLPAFLRNRGQVIIQSTFDEETVRALNNLVQSAWPDDPRAPFHEAEKTPLFRTRPILDTDAPIMDYKKEISWGVLAEDITAALNDVDELRCIEVEREVHGLRVLAHPGFLVSYKRHLSQLVLCALPPRTRNENPAQARVMRQIADNIGKFFLEEVR